MTSKKWVGAAVAALLAAAVSVPCAHAQDFKERRGIRRVLLISVDGMHAVDYLNCSKGIAGANRGARSRRPKWLPRS
jgi:hypothetical protein